MTTTGPVTTDLVTTDLVADYLDAWNAGDPAERRARLERLCAPGVCYVDPLADVTGVEALDALISGVQEQFAGLRFTPVGAVDAHHDVCRFRWGLGPEGAEPVVIGFDVAVLDADGRITAVHGFLDRVPEGA
jgi:hypothetical protein